MNAAGGSNVTFSVAATGAMSFQWSNDDGELVDSDRIIGATTAELTIVSVMRSDEGFYFVVADNGTSNITSDSATLQLACEFASFRVYIIIIDMHAYKI